VGMEEAALYDELGVAQTAAPEEIAAAYRRLAREFHPDRNRQPGAAERMKRINAAYAVLRAPSRRAQYDARLRRAVGAAPERATPAGAPPPVFCQRCGRLDATLRFSVFTTVVGPPLFSRRTAHPGCFCAACRRDVALRCNLQTAALGFWGVPRGTWWSLQALWINGRGGQQPAVANARLLRAAAAELWARGIAAEGVAADRLTLEFEDDRETAERVAARLRAEPRLAPLVEAAAARSRRGVRLEWMAPACVALALVAAAGIAGALRPSPASPAAPVVPPAAASVRAALPAAGAAAWWGEVAPVWNQSAQAEAALNAALQHTSSGSAGWRSLDGAGIAFQGRVEAAKVALGRVPPGDTALEQEFTKAFMAGLAEWAVGASTLTAAAGTQDGIKARTAIATIEAGDATLVDAQQLMPSALLPPAST